MTAFRMNTRQKLVCYCCSFHRCRRHRGAGVLTVHAGAGKVFVAVRFPCMCCSTAILYLHVGVYVSCVLTGAVIVLTTLGFLAVAVTAFCDCWRPGEAFSKSNQPRRLNRTCCGITLFRGMIVPLVLTVCLGLLVLAFAVQDDLCRTPLGYCATISCVAGQCRAMQLHCCASNVFVCTFGVCLSFATAVLNCCMYSYVFACREWRKCSIGLDSVRI